MWWRHLPCRLCRESPACIAARLPRRAETNIQHCTATLQRTVMRSGGVYFICDNLEGDWPIRSVFEDETNLSNIDELHRFLREFLKLYTLPCCLYYHCDTILHVSEAGGYIFCVVSFMCYIKLRTVVPRFVQYSTCSQACAHAHIHSSF